MGIGALINQSQQGLLVADVQAAGAVLVTTTAAALGLNAPVIMGDNKCVAPMADSVTGRLPRQIPGGGYMEKVVLVLPNQPLAGDPKKLVRGPNKLK